MSSSTSTLILVATIDFSLAGRDYQIDLVNATALEEALAPFIAAGRRRSRQGQTVIPRSTKDNAAIRAWARGAGFKVAARGQIPADIVREYDRTHG